MKEGAEKEGTTRNYNRLGEIADTLFLTPSHGVFPCRKYEEGDRAIFLDILYTTYLPTSLSGQVINFYGSVTAVAR